MSCNYRRFDVTCHPRATNALGYDTEYLNFDEFVTRISTWVRRRDVQAVSLTFPAMTSGACNIILVLVSKILL
jgi:hypothetical protein